MKLLISCIVILVIAFGCKSRHFTATGQSREVSKGELLFSEDFSGKLDTTTWVIEMAPLPNSSVTVDGGNLVIDTKGGVTVWLNKKLSGNYIIRYSRTVKVEGKINDRLSDLNQFWNATDPANQLLFTRSGVFEEYHNLLSYYVGFGGNHNTTTRFRRYDGTGERVIVGEHVVPPFLLEPNKTYLIETRVINGNISFWVNGVLYFEFTDPEPIEAGYFGFRSTWSRHHVDFIRIYRVD